MSAALTFDRYVDVIAVSASRMVDVVEAAGLEADVVTCPGWDGRALLAHQAMVHRWAAAHVRGQDADAVPDESEIARTVDDLGGFFRSGLDELVAALRSAPDDLEALVFLKDAPPAKLFWARRQAHENTMHMVDALSAVLGRAPTTSDAGIEHEVAVDGIDELLAGFMTRGKSKLFDGTEFDLLVAPSNSERRWSLHIAERMTTTEGESDRSDVTLTGSAAALYLALWNRGDEVDVAGDDSLLARWHARQHVRWN